MDSRWYLDINRWARSTSWAHWFVTAYFQRVPGPVGLGLIFLAALIVLGWWSARRDPGALPAVAWAALGGAAAYFLSLLAARALAQSRPYHTLTHVEVLVRPITRYGFPDSRVAVAGAVVCGLALAKRWVLLVVSVVGGGLLAFAGVYVGVDYPSDVVGGAVFGAVVYLLAWPLMSRSLAVIFGRLAGGPLGGLVRVKGGGRPRDKRAVGRPFREPRMPTARAMEALRAATEASRAHAGSAGPAARPGPDGGDSQAVGAADADKRRSRG